MLDQTIDTIEVLKMLLTRAYWLEKQQEQANQWLAYLSVTKEESKDIVFKLLIDSEKNKTMLQHIIATIKDFDLAQSLQHYALNEKAFDLTKKEDKEIFSELLKNKRIALDLYSRLHESTSKTLIDQYWTGDRPEEYYEQVAGLIEQEKEHVRLVELVSSGEIVRIL